MNPETAPFEHLPAKHGLSKGLTEKMDRILSALGLARKAGKLVFGTDAVVDAVRGGKALLVVTASDASAATLKRLADKTAFYKANSEPLPHTCRELGSAFGKPLCACAAVCDVNFVELYRQAKLKTAEVN